MNAIDEGRLPRIAVLGSVNMDIVVSVPMLAKPGMTVLGQEPFYAPGGKGANQAVAAAQLGGLVSFIGSVGNDQFGTRLADQLSRAGVNLDLLQVRNSSTSGIAFVAVDPDGENSITVCPGANGVVSEEDVARAAAVIGQAEVVVSQLEVPMATVEQLAEVCAAVPAKFVLNAAPYQYLSPKLISRCDYLILNRDEAQHLSGQKVDDTISAIAAARQVRDRGAGTVIVTLGAMGCVAVDDDGIHQVGTFPVSVVDSTGAGDAFVGAFSVALAEGHSLLDALVFASAAGAVACGYRGAQSEELDRAAVGEIMADRAVRVQHKVEPAQ